jgi:pentatricopeptide repeat protein
MGSSEMVKLRRQRNSLEFAIEKDIDPGVMGYNAMIKGFCKFGMMKVRKGGHAPDVFTYTTLIDGYVKQHDLDGALKMLGLMVKERCKPNVAHTPPS